MSGPPPPKTAPSALPSEAELSRIAREAVHQPADPRLDRQLARLGGVDADDAVDGQPDRATRRANESSAEIERLTARVRRIELILGVVIVAVGVVAIATAIQLLR